MQDVFEYSSVLLPVHGGLRFPFRTIPNPVVCLSALSVELNQSRFEPFHSQ